MLCKQHYRTRTILPEKDDVGFKEYLKSYMFKRAINDIYEKNKDEKAFLLELDFAIEQEDHFGITGEALKLDVTASGWTLVSQELPDKPMDVLLTVKLPFSAVARGVIPAYYGRCHGKMGFVDVCTNSFVDEGRLEIIAWMPFPNPY